MWTAMTVVSAALAIAPSPESSEPRHAPRIRTLLVTGQNNHNWWFTSRVHQETLEATGRFEVTITEDPARDLADAEQVARYQLFVLDYNGPRWGDAAEVNFLKAVSDGAGVAIIHAANNAFVGWSEYERLCGLMWINGTTGHGEFHRFDVQIVDVSHPITRGMKDLRNHPDELYHRLVNTQGVPYTLLAKAVAAKERGGSGVDEPMALTIEYGRGRVFHTPLGHVWKGNHDQKASILDLQFRALLCRGAEWAATGAVTLPPEWVDVRPHNTLSPEDAAAGWRLLFDGQAPEHFRAFKGKEFPEKGWSVRDGAIHHAAGAGGGDIVTREQFADFEFECEWKVAPGGNSGIMYRVGESGNYPWETGPEMQVLDDGGHADGKVAQTRAGTLYAIAACEQDVSRPAGEWNRARVVCRGTRVEHWLNGVKVVDFDFGSDEGKARIAATKFKARPAYASLSRGHVALQDHGDDVWFRNIRVRELSDR